MNKTQEEITKNMRSNKSKDTKPELTLRKELWKRGLRYRKNYKRVIGKPDIVFVSKKIAIFVDGKMWHGYDWNNQKNDFKSHREFWIPKIERNIWPSATWAVVDYYCEPKQVYYQMKRSYAPTNVTFVQNENKRLQLVIINDGLSDFSADIVYGLRTLSGETLWCDCVSVDVKSGEKSSSDIVKEYNKENCYLFAEYVLAGEKQSAVFSYDMWHTCKFESDYQTNIQKTGEKYAVTVKANKFAKGITLRMPDNYRFSYSDNYFDLQAGESKTVYIDGATDDDIKNIVITDFAKECR